MPLFFLVKVTEDGSSRYEAVKRYSGNGASVGIAGRVGQWQQAVSSEPSELMA